MIINIKNLHVETIIGISDHERQRKQALCINLLIHYDGTTAAQRDNIASAVDYKKLSDDVTQFVETTHFKLLETLSQQIAKRIMTDERIEYTEVEVKKLNVYAMKNIDSVSITHSISRNQKYKNYLPK